MKISQKGIDLIKSFEGFRQKMYLDSAGLPTIGYGTLIDEDSEQWLKTATITKDEGERILVKEMSNMEARMAKIIKSNLSQNQYDALCSFCYNLGVSALRRSTLLILINTNPNDPVIRIEFCKWVNVNGEKSAGLYSRRVKESDLYFS